MADPVLLRPARRFLAALVLLYPPGFRKAVGGHLRQLLHDRARKEARRGAITLLLFCLSNLVICLRDATLEWLTTDDAGRTEKAPGAIPTRAARASLVDGLAQDVRHAVRGLHRSPGFTTAAVLTLALGIGGNAAIFSVLNSVILRPLPYPAPDRLVQMFELNPELAAAQGQPFLNSTVSAHNYRDYREMNTVFEEMGWISTGARVNLTGGGRPQRIGVASASASLFSTLGIEPMLGRTWLPAEGEFAFDGPRVAILSHGLWIRQFGGDPTVLGRTITVDEWPHTVVGVMPPDFSIPSMEYQGALSSAGSDTELYVPLYYNAFSFDRRARQFSVIARLREGVGVEQAEGEMESLAAGLAETYPAANQGWSVRLIPLRDLVTREVGPQIALVMAAVGLVLLIGCANVANLLLARGTTRSPEIAVRAAMGGGRSRIVRQLLTESLVLATAAGGLGLLLAYAGTQVLVGLIPAGFPRAGETSIDGTVLAFVTLVTLGTGVVFGLVPALRASHTDLATAMRGGAGQVTGRTRGAMSRVLVTVEVALALVLLVGAGLLARNFARLAGADLGYEPTNLLKVSLDLGRPNTYNSKYFTCDPNSGEPTLWNRCPRNTAGMERFYDQIVERVERVPGVLSAALGSAPLGPGGISSLGIPGTADPQALGETTPGSGAGETEAVVMIGNTGQSIVRPGYFQTMGMRILAGRDFLVDDPSLTSSRWRIGWLGVAVVNETLAHRVWPGENPLGKRITFYGGGDWMTVIGVVEDVQHARLSDRAKDQNNSLESRVYFLMYMPRMDLLVHTAGDPNALIEPIREAVLELDPGLPTGAMATLEQLAAESNAAPRFYAQMLGIFAGFALLLTAVGLYGLVAFTVGRRTKEIGLRMALGAHRLDIKKMAMGHAAKSVGLGVAIGVAASLALASVLENFLFGMDPLDPLTYAVVVLVLAGIAAGASYLPASRASRLDPTDALGHE